MVYWSISQPHMRLGFGLAYFWYIPQRLIPNFIEVARAPIQHGGGRILLLRLGRGLYDYYIFVFPSDASHPHRWWEPFSLLFSKKNIFFLSHFSHFSYQKSSTLMPCLHRGIVLSHSLTTTFLWLSSLADRSHC